MSFSAKTKLVCVLILGRSLPVGPIGSQVLCDYTPAVSALDVAVDFDEEVAYLFFRLGRSPLPSNPGDAFHDHHFELHQQMRLQGMSARKDANIMVPRCVLFFHHPCSARLSSPVSCCFGFGFGPLFCVFGMDRIAT